MGSRQSAQNPIGVSRNQLERLEINTILTKALSILGQPNGFEPIGFDPGLSLPAHAHLPFKTKKCDSANASGGEIRMTAL
jgi:hypothetical protein